MTPEEEDELLQEGLRLKREGMESAAEAKPILLEIARSAARRIALKDPNRESDMDQVRDYMNYIGLADVLGPASGSVFKGPGWEFTGKRVTSWNPKNHARELKVWRLVS